MSPRVAHQLAAVLADLQTLTIQDLAARYQVTDRTIYKWRARGLIPPPAIRLARGTLRWTLAQITAAEVSALRQIPALSPQPKPSAPVP